MLIARISRLAVLLSAIAACLVLGGCEEKITQANYEQIENGMTKTQVERLLGSGRDETPSAGSGISAGGLLTEGDAPDEVWVWESADGAKIVVTFAEGKVVQKSQQGLE